MLTDLLEVHIIELKKALRGTDAVIDWIRLFNAENEEDLKMIKAKSNGISEAMEVLQTLSLRKSLCYLHEERLKAIRDRKAEDEYVREMGRSEGRAEGETVGEARGKAEGKAESVLQLLGELGNVSDDLRAKIMVENDTDTLSSWLKTAARTETVDAFRERCKL